MTEQDEFDTGLELEDNAPDAFDEGFDDAGLEAEEETVKAKKSGGGFFVKFLLLLIVLGGGLFASVKYLGVQLPFNVPFLSDLAAGPAVPPPQPVAENTVTTPEDTIAATSLTDTADWGVDAPSTDDTMMVGGDTPAFGDVDVVDDVVAVDPADSFGMPTETSAPVVEDTDLSAWPVTDAPVDTANTADVAIMPVADDVMPDAFATTPDVKTAETQMQMTASTGDTAALEKKFAALEKTVQQLKSSTATKSDLDAVKASLAKIEKSLSDLKAAPVAATTSKKAPVEASSTAVEKAPVKAAPKKAVEKPVVHKNWTLRSAKPGTAWISEKGASEMKTVSVGDNVAGIGKVTAIAKDDSGRWVVSGTRGKINQ